MPTLARGPKVLKGALVSIVDGGQPSVIAFQYNPATVKRSLKPLMVGGESGDRSLAVRLVGAPIETITADVEFDATDGLEAGDSIATTLGIRPQLAALALLVYPTSQHVISTQAQLDSGILEIAPNLAPRLLFVWGPKQVQPVQISSFSISEEEFDTSLNPIRATVGLEMRVLTYSDLASSNADYHQYLSYQQGLESMAPSAVTSDMAPIGSISISSAPAGGSGIGGAISAGLSIADNVLSSVL
jgi:hypothetical protein